MSMSGIDAQVSLWNILPQGVIETILRKLSVRDGSACPILSCCWASAVRSAVHFECMMHVQPCQLRSRLQALQQASSRQYIHQKRPASDVSYTLQLTESLNVVSCAKLLTSLVNKSLRCPPCTINIPLMPLADRKTPTAGVTESICNASIGEAVSQLAADGVSIYISLQAPAGTELPSPAKMKSVASITQQVDYAQAVSMTSGAPKPQEWERFSEDHLLALKSARKQMQVLCISDALAVHQFRRESISLVARFRQLKKLVLQTKAESPDLSSLTQLKRLEDVSLVVSGQGDCAELIHSQRAKLMYIRLSATSWADATYHALSMVTGLQTLVVNVHCLSTSGADSIASLQRPHGIHVVLRKGSDSQRSTLQSLSRGSKVTELTLMDCTSSILDGLGRCLT